jgi:hypothetical protein
LDPVMQGHIVLVIKREVAVHCCGKNILKWIYFIKGMNI